MGKHPGTPNSYTKRSFSHPAGFETEPEAEEEQYDATGQEVQ